MKNPALRFKHADGTDFPNWENKKIGNILSIFHGKDYHGIPEGEIPVLGTSGKIASVSKALCSWPCVLIGRKGTINRPQYMESPFWPVDTIFYSKPKEKNNVKFQYYLFQTISWMKFNEASGVPSLNASTIESISIHTPNIEEQKKIADFFSTLDEKISLSERRVEQLEQLKKGLMQKIFSREIRFLQADGTDFPDWLQMKISDFADLLTGFPFESSKFTTDGIRLVKGANIKRGNLSFAKESSSYWPSMNGLQKFELNEGDLLIQMDGALVGKSYGIVTKDILPAILVQRVTRVRCNSAKLQILYQYFWIGDFDKFIKKTVTNTAVPHISLTDISSFEIMLPSSQIELEKLAEFLGCLERKIDLSKIKLMKIKKLKKAFMQQMFV